MKSLPLAALSKLPGDAGGTAANVNRWRKQVGLAPSPEIGGECDTISPHHDTLFLHREALFCQGDSMRESEEVFTAKTPRAPSQIEDRSCL
jgi:hypothetical protein